jgi:hypothetical protein
LTITRTGANTVLASFAKGATSTGGSIQIGSASPAPFTNGIDALTADANGVTWSNSGNPPPPPPPPSGSRCDIDTDGSTNIVDVQLCVNQAIAILPCTTADIDLNGSCNVVDVQRVVNAALGGPCVTP